MSTREHARWKATVVKELVSAFARPKLLETFELIVRDELILDTADVLAEGSYRRRITSIVEAVDRAQRLPELITHLQRQHGFLRLVPAAPVTVALVSDASNPRMLAIECDRARQWSELQPLLLAGGFGTILVPGPAGEEHALFLDRVEGAVKRQRKIHLGVEGDYDLASNEHCLAMLAHALKDDGVTADRDSVVDGLARMAEEGVTTIVGSRHFFPDDRDRLHVFYLNFLPPLLLEVRDRAARNAGPGRRGLLFVHAITRDASVLDRDWLPRFLLPAPRFLRALRSRFVSIWQHKDLRFYVGRELLRIPDEEAIDHLEKHAIPIDDVTKRGVAQAVASKGILHAIERAARQHFESRSTVGEGRPGA